MQNVYNPARYCFEWTPDGWYTWDRAAAHKQARAARDKQAKFLKSEGHVVAKFSLPSQLITVGGIGSGKPEITLCCTCYGIDF